MSKPASAFASASSGGRTLSWESLSVEYTPTPLTTHFPNNAKVIGGLQLAYRVILPVNPLRGAITLERARGHVAFWVDDADVAATLANGVLSSNIQLVPVDQGAITDDAVLSPADPFDLESNRVLWRRTYLPDLQAADTVPQWGGLRLRPMWGDTTDRGVLDIKVKRRFDRANWALIQAVLYNAVNFGNAHAMSDIRALFLAPDGL